jgi:hypothetical protein
VFWTYFPTFSASRLLLGSAGSRALLGFRALPSIAGCLVIFLLPKSFFTAAGEKRKTGPRRAHSTGTAPQRFFSFALEEMKNGNRITQPSG